MASTNNYTLGRGEIHFGQFRPGTQTPRGELYFGNTPDLSFSAEQETLDHYASDYGIRVKDQSVLLQLDYTGSFSTDNISPFNLAVFFLGEHGVKTDAGATVTDEVIGTVEPGLSYQLGASDANPSGVRKVEDVVLTAGASPLVAGTDYVVDLELGRVTILDTATISPSAEVKASYTVEPSTRDFVISRGQTIEGSMRFIARNPAGKNIDYFMPWVKITPNGDFAVKSDEWQNLPFTIEILKKGALEAIYMDGRPYTT